MKENAQTIEVEWKLICGPGQMDDESFRSIRNEGGIYLRLFRGRREQVAYVGKANNFESRFMTHFALLLGGLYTTYDIQESKDLLPFLRDHVIGKKLDEALKDPNFYMPVAGRKGPFSFQKAFFDPKRFEKHRAYLRRLRFAFGIIEDQRYRSPAESILMLGLRRLYAQAIGKTDEEFCLPEGQSRDSPLGTITRYPVGKYRLRHGGKALASLPKEVKKITGCNGREPLIAPNYRYILVDQ